MSGGTGLLLLCEAELGKPMYEIPTGDSGAQEKAQEHGAIATLGVGRTAPQGWTDAGFIREDLKGVSLPDVKKGLGDNKAAKATGYLMFNEYVSSFLFIFFNTSLVQFQKYSFSCLSNSKKTGTLHTTSRSCE